MLSPLLASGPSTGDASSPCGGRFFKDLDPDLKGEVNGITSPRFMRRMWIHDGHLLALIQQGGYQGRFLSLYRARDAGTDDWQLVDTVAGVTPPDRFLSGDGVLLPGGDLVLVVSSRQALFAADVRLYRYNYRGGGSWALDPSSPATVIPSSSSRVIQLGGGLMVLLRVKSNRLQRMLSRMIRACDVAWGGSRRHINATLAQDSMKRLFVSYVKIDEAGDFAIRCSYSTNEGLDWVEAEKAFTRPDRNHRKNARVSTVRVGGRNAVALVYYDHDDAGQYLRWAYRLDSEPPEAAWTLDETTGLIRAMPANASPSMYKHWSLARDGQNRLHLTWQEPDGIYYSRFDGDPVAGWAPPTFLVGGVYSNVTTSVGSGESFVYVFADHQTGIVGAAHDPMAKEWTPFYQIGAAGPGNRRVSSPEQFVGGAGGRLPVLYQNRNDPPAPATQLLLSVLLECR